MPAPVAQFDWNLAFMHHRDCLPHVRQANVIYFVTFRLADSLPAKRVEQLRLERDRWLAENPPPHTLEQADEFRKTWTFPLERLLDAGHGACLLRSPDCRAVMEGTMRHGDRTHYSLGSFVIMPNHVHALVHVRRTDDLSNILQAWKSISARRLNRLLGRRGTVWQAESFDHIVRDGFYLQRFAKYIEKNPAHLAEGTFTLARGSLSPENCTRKG